MRRTPGLGGGEHPDLATHDALGLATQAELDGHGADTTSVHGIADTSALALSSHDHDADYEAVGTVATHTGDTIDAHDASAISFSATGAIAATDVQAAIAELDSEKAATSHAHTTITANRQTDSYTLVLGDAGLVVEMNKATANNLTVPPNADVAFPTGTVLEVMQYGAGQTTIVAGAGVTIRSSGGKLKLAAQYASASLRKIAADEWAAAGELSA